MMASMVGANGKKWDDDYNRWKTEWTGDDINDESATGPKAQSPDYEPPDAVVDKILKQFEEKSAPDFWGLLYPCDRCERFLAFRDACVQCNDEGEVINSHGEGNTIAEAMDAIQAIIDGTEQPTERKDFKAMKNESKVMCFECYGSEFKGDREFFVNTSTRTLRLKRYTGTFTLRFRRCWYTLHKKRKAINLQEVDQNSEKAVKIKDVIEKFLVKSEVFFFQ